MRGFNSPPSDKVLDKVGDNNLYKLSDYTIDQLQPILDDWANENGFQSPNLKDVRVQFGVNGPGSAGYTANERITLDVEQWQQVSHREGAQGQVALLAHEVTHTVQHQQLGGGVVGIARRS